LCLTIVKYIKDLRHYRSSLIGMFSSLYMCSCSYTTKGYALCLPPTIFPGLQSNQACSSASCPAREGF
jgi:hypothetical protein